MLALLLEEELSGAVATLVDEMFAVPSHWEVEVGNGLLVAERRGRIRAEDTELLLRGTQALAAERDDAGLDGATAATLALARRHRLTVYDALYLELAARRSLPLATLDAALRRAAGAEGIALVP
jgi:predicted nucleic acid-binding protein